MLTLSRRRRARNAPKFSTKYLKDRICKIKQYFIYILRIINPNILAILRSFLSHEKIYTKQTFTAATTELLSKILNRKKISNELLNVCEAKISSDETIISINSEKNNNSPGNDGLTAEFYKYFSNKVTPILIDVYDSWGKLGTMGVTWHHGCYFYSWNHICYIQKGDKKVIRPISLLKLDYKIYSTNS